MDYILGCLVVATDLAQGGELVGPIPHTQGGELVGLVNLAQGGDFSELTVFALHDRLFFDAQRPRATGGGVAR